jgi:hypothetical protein
MFIFNAFLEDFTPGTFLGFDVNLTTNFAGSGAFDRFSFALLDGSGGEIPTTGAASEFVGVDLRGGSAIVETYSAQSPYAGMGSAVTTTALVTPEGSSLGLLAAGCLPLVGGWLYRTRRKVRPSSSS